jgi:polysaccharide export outer membrane protein
MRSVLVSLLVLGLLGVASAQEESTAPPREDYRIVVGDQIQINVIGHEDYSTAIFVPMGGGHLYPAIGYVELAGRKLVDVSEDIQKRFADKEILLDPQVSVFVMTYAPRKVYLTGSVYSVVDLPVHKPMTLLQVIAQAGGWGDGDKRNVRIIRKKADGDIYTIPLDAERIMAEEDWDKNIKIMPEDMIYIPPRAPVEQMRWVYVLGNVNSPGPQPYMRGREPITLGRLISIVGGFSQYARRGAVRIIRKGAGRSRVIVVDFDEIIDGERDDVVLQPDDLVFVPESIF